MGFGGEEEQGVNKKKKKRIKERNERQMKEEYFSSRLAFIGSEGRVGLLHGEEGLVTLSIKVTLYWG